MLPHDSPELSGTGIPIHTGEPEAQRERLRTRPGGLGPRSQLLDVTASLEKQDNPRRQDICPAAPAVVEAAE